MCYLVKTPQSTEIKMILGPRIYEKSFRELEKKKINMNLFATF